MGKPLTNTCTWRDTHAQTQNHITLLSITYASLHRHISIYGSLLHNPIFTSHIKVYYIQILAATIQIHIVLLCKHNNISYITVTYIYTGIHLSFNFSVAVRLLRAIASTASIDAPFANIASVVCILISNILLCIYIIIYNLKKRRHPAYHGG